MFKRLAATTFIYFCTSVAWLFLSATVFFRSGTQNTEIKQEVRQLWGEEQNQQAPAIYYIRSNNKTLLSPETSNIEVDLQLEHRKKGLQWYSTYTVGFSSEYEIKNTTGQEQQIFIDFMFPSSGAIYDDFHFIIGGEEIEEIEINKDSLTKSVKLLPQESETIKISYISHGLDEWDYIFGSDVRQVKDFSLSLTTNFEDIDFPDDSLSPTSKIQTDDGWELEWRYTNLLTGVKIGMIMPHKLNPGPWVARVTMAAPVSLFLFFFLMFVLTEIKKIKVHPMNYFFVGTGFFSFHLLLAYLVDHVSIHLSFWICSAVSVFLVVSYMRLVVGKRFAFIQIAFSQLIYLVLFSYTFFFVGYTGLAITILCICTLFVIMQLTGKIDWDKIFEKKPVPVKIDDSRNPTEKGTG